MTLNSPANLDLTHSNLGTEEVVRPTKLVVSCRSDFGCCVDESTAARYLRLQHASCTPPQNFCNINQLELNPTELSRNKLEPCWNCLSTSQHSPQPGPRGPPRSRVGDRRCGPTKLSWAGRWGMVWYVVCHKRKGHASAQELKTTYSTNIVEGPHSLWAAGLL